MNLPGICWPERLNLARLPTPVEPLPRISAEEGVEIWVKRDDLTGTALSGNKVRKLEFVLAEARRRGARTVLTCGGIQSNHARATAVAAARLGLRAHLLLRVHGAPPPRPEGNLLLDRLAGASVQTITPEEYRRADEIMAELAARESPPAYAIPEGASNALGALGYALAAGEIVEAEKRLGLRFDAVVHAVGSGGTSAGLILGKKAFGLGARICGVNVCDDEAYFRRRITGILRECAARYAPHLGFSEEDVTILDGYVGPGYAQSSEGDLAALRRLPRLEGVFLDPVYTAKAFHGMLREIRGGRLADCGRILFLHTGGIFGLFARGAELLG